MSEAPAIREKHDGALADLDGGTRETLYQALGDLKRAIAKGQANGSQARS